MPTTIFAARTLFLLRCGAFEDLVVRALVCVIAAVCAVYSVENVAAQEAVVPLRFAEGRANVAIGGSVAGFTTRYYAFETRAGQQFEINVTSPSQFICFEVIAPNGLTLYRGTTAASDLRRFAETAPYGGPYMVSVFFRRDEAMRRSSAAFTLNLAMREQGRIASPPTSRPNRN